MQMLNTFAKRSLNSLFNVSILPYKFRFMLKYAPRDARSWTRELRQTVKTLLAYDALVPEERLERKYRDALDLLIGHHDSGSLGDYLEFGVGYGTSMACMNRTLKHLGIDHVRLFGFDSFQGLPDTGSKEDSALWLPGQFRVTRSRVERLLGWQGVNMDQVTLIKGWFSDTLNDELIRRHHLEKASVVMIDCDIYSAAKEALNFCVPLIQDACVVLFDDWHAGFKYLSKRDMGEKKAYTEFLAENPQFKSKRLKGYNKHSEVFFLERVESPASPQ